MKIFFPFLITTLFYAQCLFAQPENATLLAQSPDGKTVKLLWLFKSWNSEITGFDIKRKDGLKDWVKLNAEPILPSLSAKKKLSVVESDKLKESMVRAKLLKLLSGHRLQETDNNTFLQKLNSSEKAVQEISNMITHDYDVALMSGFAYVDHTITKKTDYQYGLFIQGTDKLLSKVSWNYGEIPDLNAVKEITSKSTTKNNGIQVIWNADPAKVKTGNVAGFNIYREGIRLNSSPVTAQNSNDPSEYTWNDKPAVSKTMNQYSISAESIFGIEGIIKPYTYDPADHPKEYKVTEVSQINSMGFYFKEGINVKWTFPREYERFIKGFYVEKDNLPQLYKRISKLLEPATRTYTDTTPSPVTAYIKFKIIAVYIDKTEVPGTEKMYNYFPVGEPPAPQNVRIKSTVGEKKAVITLSWDPAVPGDSVTDFYRVYFLDTITNKFTPVPVNESVKAGKYTYTVYGGKSAVYKFAVSSISRTKTESSLSDTVFVTVPSLELPVAVINKVSLDSNRAVVKWKYPEVADLKGFRVYENNSVIASESELGKNIREFTTQKLQPGATYNFSVKAVSENGVTSELAAPVPVIVPAASKR